MLSLAGAPVTPSLELTGLVVFFSVPAVTPVTFTLNVHDELGVSLAPDKKIVFVAGPVLVVPPPQLPVKPLGTAISRPSGKGSAKLRLVKGVSRSLLKIVKVNEVVPFTGMRDAPKAFVMVGGC